ncbi:MAG: aminopeptidase P family protein [Ideonella sp.]|nr:aminopeptidase P family protein [Ideonella sp.]
MLLNKPRLQNLLRAKGWLGLLATTPESVTYLSGYWAMPQWIRRGPQVYAFQGADSGTGSFVVTGTGLSDQAADQTLWVDDVHRYGEFFVTPQLEPANSGDAMPAWRTRWVDILTAAQHDSPAKAVAAALQKAGVTGGAIGIEEDGIGAAQLAAIRAACPGVRFEDAGDFSKRVRAIKTPAEISRLRSACRIAERSIYAALQGAHAGESEYDLLRRFNTQTVADGAYPVLYCIGIGERSAMPNVDPSRKQRLSVGQTVRFDVGGRFEHYRADIARIAAFGDVPAASRRAHAAVQAGIEHALEIIRPGLAGRELFDAVVGIVRRAGLPHYQRNHVGHGIGLDGYEVPALTPTSIDVLEPGMVMCIETPYYELGHAGFQVEDMVMVTETGVQSLMSLPHRLLDCPATGSPPVFDESPLQVLVAGSPAP